MKKKRKKSTKPTKHTFKTIQSKIFIAILFILPLIYFASLLSGTKMMYGSDWLSSGYPSAKLVADYIRQYGGIPKWNPYVFGGIPGGNPYSLYTLFDLIFSPHLTQVYLFVLAIFLAGVGIYLFLKELKISSYPALFASIAYMGAGSLLSMPYPGHFGKTMAAALFPFVLLFLHKGLTKHTLIYFLFAGAIGGFSATQAHFQLTYYAGWVSVFYLLVQLIWQRKENKLMGTIKLLFYSFLGLLLAGGLAAVKFTPIFAGIGWGSRGGIVRGYQFATSWSLSAAELLDLLTPHFSGILNNYWGENFFKLDTQYLGILPLLLALIAIVVKYKEKYVKFFAGLGIFATLFALGGHTPFYRIPYYFFPYIKKFRGPAMAFYLVAFSVAVLSAFGIQALVDSKKTKAKANDSVRKIAVCLLIVFGVVALFSIVCIGAKDSILSVLKSHFEPILQAKYGAQLAQQKMANLYRNYPHFLNSLGKALLLIAINAILIIGLVTRKLKLGTWTLIVIPILIFDQWSVEKQFLKTVPHPREYYAPDSVVSFLKRDQTIYRVFPLHYEHTTDSYLSLHGIQSVGGYVSNPYHRYQDLIGAGKSVMFNAPNLVKYRKFLDILNVKYIIGLWLPEDLSGYDEETQKAIKNFKRGFLRKWGVSWEDAHKGLKLVYNDRRGQAVYENETVLPRAWIASDYEVLAKDKVLNRMKESNFNPRLTVILEQDPRVPHLETLENPGKVKIDTYSPNKIICVVELSSPGWLVLSENWHPAWKAWVDGERTKVYLADYVLRAVRLEKGRHTVKLVFDPGAFKIGSRISFSFLLFLVSCVIYWERIRRKK